MKKTLITLCLFGMTSISYSQTCTMQIFGGGSQSVGASWQSVINQNSTISYLHTGDPCPVFVGIGTSTPTSELFVDGTTYTSRLALGVNPQTMAGYFHMKVPVSSTYSFQFDIFRIENADRQLLNLDNTGLLRTREIIIDALVWPDYVFDKNYYLMPLSEVEEFIEENGHLPNVPSQEEAEAEGQSLGEMNKVLLEKIEELTLHLIEQQKQIEELKQLEELKVQMQNK